MKICIVLSTRPEIIKLAPIIKLLQSKKKNFFLINTNQHHIKNMSDIFFNFFDIPEPKYNIRAPNKTYGGFPIKKIKEFYKREALIGKIESIKNKLVTLDNKKWKENKEQ